MVSLVHKLLVLKFWMWMRSRAPRSCCPGVVPFDGCHQGTTAHGRPIFLDMLLVLGQFGVRDSSESVLLFVILVRHHTLYPLQNR